MPPNPPDQNQPNPSSRAETGSEPNRLCIGCRQHGLRSELVRLVVRMSCAANSGELAKTPQNDQIIVDIRKCLPGRGAWLHQSQNCFDLSVRRRAFSRALRVQNADWSAVQAYLTNNTP